MSQDTEAPLHPRQPDLDEVSRATWVAALADAGISTVEAILFLFPGTQSSVERFSALTWRKGPVDGVRDPEVAAVVSQLNHPESVRTTRIAVWTGRSDAGIAALLRHELQHAKQLAIHPRLAALHEIAEDVVRLAPDSATQYQLIPTEADANSAAARFVREHFGHAAVEAMLAGGGPDSALFRNGREESAIEALPPEMIRFLSERADLCEAWAESKATFSRRIDLAWRGAGNAWECAIRGEPSVPWP